MTMTSRQILDALEQQPGTEATKGYLAARRRFDTDSPGSAYGNVAERAFLDQLANVDPPRRDPGYDSPVKAAVAPAGQEPQALTAAGIEWIKQLPPDPADVSYEDAKALAALAANVTGQDALYARSVLAPIRRLHDGRAAEVEVRNLQRRPTPPAPPGTDRLLAAAIRREEPALTEDEAAQRAVRSIADAVDRRDASHAEQIDTARAKVAAASRPWNAADAFDIGQPYRAAAEVAARTGSRPAKAAIAEHDAAIAELSRAAFGDDTA